MPRSFYGVFQGSDRKKHMNASVWGWVTGLQVAVIWTTRKKNVDPAVKKRKSLTLNRKELDRWDFISEERENYLSRKYVPKNTATTTKKQL